MILKALFASIVAMFTVIFMHIFKFDMVVFLVFYVIVSDFLRKK